MTVLKSIQIGLKLTNVRGRRSDSFILAFQVFQGELPIVIISVPWPCAGVSERSSDLNSDFRRLGLRAFLFEPPVGFCPSLRLCDVLFSGSSLSFWRWAKNLVFLSATRKESRLSLVPLR